MAFKTMDQDLARHLIEKEKDILTPAIEEERKLYENTLCPMCTQGGCKKMTRPPKILSTSSGPEIVESPFGEGPLTEGYAHCVHCDTDFNPKTGMIYKSAASILASPQSDPLQD